MKSTASIWSDGTRPRSFPQLPVAASPLAHPLTALQPVQRAGEDWRVLLFKSQVGSSKAPEIQVRLSVHPHGQPTSDDRGPLVKTSREREPVGKLWD